MTFKNLECQGRVKRGISCSISAAFLYVAFLFLSNQNYLPLWYKICSMYLHFWQLVGRCSEVLPHRNVLSIYLTDFKLRPGTLDLKQNISYGENILREMIDLTQCSSLLSRVKSNFCRLFVTFQCLQIVLLIFCQTFTIYMCRRVSPIQATLPSLKLEILSAYCLITCFVHLRIQLEHFPLYQNFLLQCAFSDSSIIFSNKPHYICV